MYKNKFSQLYTANCPIFNYLSNISCLFLLPRPMVTVTSSLRVVIQVWPTAAPSPDATFREWIYFIQSSNNPSRGTIFSCDTYVIYYNNLSPYITILELTTKFRSTYFLSKTSLQSRKIWVYTQFWLQISQSLHLRWFFVAKGHSHAATKCGLG